MHYADSAPPSSSCSAAPLGTAPRVRKDKSSPRVSGWTASLKTARNGTTYGQHGSRLHPRGRRDCASGRRDWRECEYYAGPRYRNARARSVSGTLPAGVGQRRTAAVLIEAAGLPCVRRKALGVTRRCRLPSCSACRFARLGQPAFAAGAADRILPDATGALFIGSSAQWYSSGPVDAPASGV